MPASRHRVVSNDGFIAFPDAEGWCWSGLRHLQTRFSLGETCNRTCFDLNSQLYMKYPPQYHIHILFWPDTEYDRFSQLPTEPSLLNLDPMCS